MSILLLPGGSMRGGCANESPSAEKHYHSHPPLPSPSESFMLLKYGPVSTEIGIYPDMFSRPCFAGFRITYVLQFKKWSVRNLPAICNMSQNLLSSKPDSERSMVSTVHAICMVGSSHAIGVFLAITVYVMCLSFQNVSLFSWHPAFLTLGYLLLMTEAMLILSPYNATALLRANRSTLITLHWILELLATACILIGCVTIYINKERQGRSHFVSWHAITGLTAFILTGLACIGGVVAKYSMNLRTWARPVGLKVCHITISLLTLSMGIISLCFGFYTSWFKAVTGGTDLMQVTCTVLTALATATTLGCGLITARTRFTQLL